MKSFGVRGSIAIMLILRALYAMNWYNVSPLLFNILNAYGTPFYLSGLILSAFLLGTALFQIPSGLIAAKIGAKNTAMSGMIIMSIAIILSIFSPDFLIFLISRFMVGVGAAFFFSSGVGVLYEIDRTKSSTNLAVFNTAFSIGGGIGILLFSFLSPMFSWQNLLLISGIVTLIFTICGILFIPKTFKKGSSKDFRKNVKSRFFSKPLILLSLALSGYWGMNFTFGEYEKSFAQVLGFNPTVAGLIGSLALFAGIFGLFIYRRIHIGSPAVILPSFLITICIIVAIQALGFPDYLFFASAASGVMSIILFSLEYFYVIRIEKEEKYVPLGISIMNGIQIAAGAIIASVFGYVYSINQFVSWLFLAAISMVMLPIGMAELKKINIS